VRQALSIEGWWAALPILLLLLIALSALLRGELT
jgi:hypothetical protein